MDELRHHYCNVCHEDTVHVQKTHYDGTVTQECLKCNNIELTRKGHNYKKFKEAIKKKNRNENLFPIDSFR